MISKDRRKKLDQVLEDRRSGGERRNDKRVPLGLDFAVPVVVRTDSREMFGLARNISEGGMLVQLDKVLPIGRRLEITFSGRSGQITLSGEVRHQVAWQHSGGPNRETMCGIGVRFVEDLEDELPLTQWVYQCGSTIH